MVPKDTMTPRERWLAVVRREQPDRVPLYYRATEEANAKLMAHLGCRTSEELHARLHLDPMAHVGPRYVGPSRPAGEDLYGRRFRRVEYDGGAYTECSHHPLAGFHSVAEIEAGYVWPTADWFDYSGLADQVAGVGDLVINGGGSEPFLLYKDLRGEEQAFIDLVENPELAHYCLDQLYGFCYENTRRIYEAIPGQVMVTSVAEDMGAQDRLLYSPAHLHEFFFPHLRRMMELVHQAGALVNTHSDGAIREILPDLVAMGVDILNPVQWRCAGMDREGLKRDFGGLIFEGAMDNQFTLPFGTMEEVRQEVRDNLRILGAGGGYLLAPCHNIQVVGPPENVVAMYDTAYEEGWC
ncbi:MAG: uroporphyrinogen decarboxylase family protein [Candidatus Latescibacterota bacterium]|jgi:uroporphyrinogen decarboxylase